MRHPRYSINSSNLRLPTGTIPQLTINTLHVLNKASLRPTLYSMHPRRPYDRFFLSQRCVLGSARACPRHHEELFVCQGAQDTGDCTISSAVYAQLVKGACIAHRLRLQPRQEVKSCHGMDPPPARDRSLRTTVRCLSTTTVVLTVLNAIAVVRAAGIRYSKARLLLLYHPQRTPL